MLRGQSPKLTCSSLYGDGVHSSNLPTSSLENHGFNIMETLQANIIF